MRFHSLKVMSIILTLVSVYLIFFWDKMIRPIFIRSMEYSEYWSTIIAVVIILLTECIIKVGIIFKRPFSHKKALRFIIVYNLICSIFLWCTSYDNYFPTTSLGLLTIMCAVSVPDLILCLTICCMQIKRKNKYKKILCSRTSFY